MYSDVQRVCTICMPSTRKDFTRPEWAATVGTLDYLKWTFKVATLFRFVFIQRQVTANNYADFPVYSSQDLVKSYKLYMFNVPESHVNVNVQSGRSRSIICRVLDLLLSADQ